MSNTTPSVPLKPIVLAKETAALATMLGELHPESQRRILAATLILLGFPHDIANEVLNCTLR